MELIGNSSIWCEKYRPQTVNDLILPKTYKTLFQTFVADKDIPNLLFTSTAGRGKTSTAFALCKDIDCATLYVNGSVETSIDTLRYKVTQFAMTGSFFDAKKVVIIDECERLSQNAQDGMKALIEQTEANCRFILTTNNISKIIDPIKSRCQLVDFNFNPKDSEQLMIAYFKRVCWILDQEKVKYDKSTLAEFIKTHYPDFRKIINELQKFIKMYNEITKDIFATIDNSQFADLVTEMKNKKWTNIRKVISNTDPDIFIGTFYKELEHLIQDDCKPSVINVLGEAAYKLGVTTNKEVTFASCIIDLMRTIKWR